MIVRPSYVLGGRAMKLIFQRAGINMLYETVPYVSPDSPLLLDHFLR